MSTTTLSIRIRRELKRENGEDQGCEPERGNRDS